jgi:hypothetical protein
MLLFHKLKYRHTTKKAVTFEFIHILITVVSVRQTYYSYEAQNFLINTVN